ncbi:MAG TPA: saccharopine dehydrogenase NADP-binding domain-containing protein [Roseiflexaceae bacterium]|nr:saccharopine dehydrogenase NADP-binding domain-containing protein [Roseiflexaceae bacterium]
MSPTSLLLYGANGYTGALIARLAVERGLRPILAGRSREAVAAVAGPLGLEYRVFALEDAAAVDAALAEARAVLLCAGPFAHTSRRVADACLRSRTHYLDITGEIAVFEALAARDAEARAAGIMLLPGVGFDVVPSDCLAAHLKRQLPSATQLALAFQALGRMSRGTANTAIENLARGGMVRRGGKLVAVPADYKTRTVDFGRGPVTVSAIPWGDVSTAYYSTGIPNIEVYTALSATTRRLLAITSYLRPLLSSYAAQRLLKWLVRSQPAGPSDAERARGASLLWGEVSDSQGQRRLAWLRTPEAYTLTALTALAIAEKLLAGQATAGFQTPSRAYGADLILQIPGVTREMVEELEG